MRVPLVQIYDNSLTEKGVKLYVLRLDLAHPPAGGNKWYKLKYNLAEAKSQGKTALLSFGGAYSNHIYALAAAGKENGFRTIGIIRGEETLPLNPTLLFARQCGMELWYAPRWLYRDKELALKTWREKNPGIDPYIIPEGGSNNLGVKGCTEILSEIDVPFQHVVCACGTGATLAGISLSLKDQQKVTGIPVLKGGEFLEEQIIQWQQEAGKVRKNFELQTGYHFGGYAKTTPQLLDFISAFEELHGIPLEQVYTGKMMFAVMDLARKKYFRKGDTVIAIHTGGLQGKMNVSAG